MIPEGKSTYDQEFSPSRVEPTPTIVRGVVGWKEHGEHFDIGSETNGGHTLVRVTLQYGRHFAEQTGESATGYHALCQPLGPMYWIPPVGTHVLVGFPDGNFEAPGSGYILGTIGGTPTLQFRGDRAKIDFGPDQDLVLKARSVTIMNYENTYLGVIDTGKGIRMGDKYGNGGIIGGTGRQITFFTGDASGEVYGQASSSKSVLQMTNTKFTLAVQDYGAITIDDRKYLNIVSGAVTNIKGIVFLGKSPTISNFAGVLNNGTTPTPSGSVWISVA